MLKSHSHYCLTCKRERRCQSATCLVGTVAECLNCARGAAGARVQTFILTVQTFWKSCADATHFYGIIKDAHHVKMTDIPRQNSRAEVESKAHEWLERRINRVNTTLHYRLAIKTETEHL